MATDIRQTKAITAHISAEVAKIEGDIVVGLKAAGDFVQAKAQVQTPVDTGNLRGSARNKIQYRAGQPAVVIGYLAEYTVFVHEIPPSRARHKVGNWKFLQRAVMENADTIVRIIHTNAKLVKV